MGMGPGPIDHRHSRGSDRSATTGAWGPQRATCLDGIGRFRDDAHDNGCAHLDSGAYLDPRTGVDANSDAHAQTYPNSHAHAQAYSDTDGRAHVDPGTYAYANGDTNADTNGHA